MYVYRGKLTIPKGKRLYLIPLGDIQGEEELHRLDELIDWCVKQIKAGHLVRLFGTGDYFETFSPSERVKKAGANFHETTLENVERFVKAQADDVIRRFTPLKGCFFVIGQGHHWDNVKVGRGVMSTDQYIAESLDAEFAGDGFIIMELLINGYNFRIVAMHGYGSGRTGGYKLNKRAAMREVFLNANWYAMGHDNSKIIDCREPLIINNGKVTCLKQYFSGVGCFQRAYHLDKTTAGYAERLALPPASIGAIIGNIEVNETEKRLNYHVSA